MNNDTTNPSTPSTDGLGLPPIPSPMPVTPPVPTPPLPPPPMPIEPMGGGLPPLEPITPPLANPPEEEKSKEEKPKKKVNKKLVFGGTIVLFLVAGVVALAAQFGLFKGYLGSRAGTTICTQVLKGYSCHGGAAKGRTCGSSCGPLSSCQADYVKVCTVVSTPTPTPAPQPTAPQPTQPAPTGGGNGNICETGGVTASVCYGVAVNGRCTGFNGLCQKTGTNSSGYATCGCKADTPQPTTVTGGGCTTLGAPCTTSTGTGNCRATGAPNGAMYCQVTITPAPTVTGGTSGAICIGYTSGRVGSCSADTQGCGAGFDTEGGSSGGDCGIRQVCCVPKSGSGLVAAGGACTTPSQCQLNLTCVNAFCVGGCGSNNALACNNGCNTGLTMGIDGRCHTGTSGGTGSVAAGGACTTPSQCVSGLACVNGTCVGGCGGNNAIPCNNGCNAGLTLGIDGRCSGTASGSTCKTRSSAPACNGKLAGYNVGVCTCRLNSGANNDCSCVGNPVSTPAPTGIGGPTTPPTCGTCGGSGQACCVPQNCQAKPICNGGLYCNGGTCTTGTNICGGSQGSGGSASGQCTVYKCGNQCNNGNQCSLNATTVACSSASLGGQCGQIDYLNGSSAYCGVMVQNCYGACAGTVATGGGTGGGTTPTQGPPGVSTNPTVTATATAGVAAACVNTRLFINGSTTAATADQMNAVKINDTIRMVVVGNSPTLVGAKFIVKIGGTDVSNGGFLVTTNLTPIRSDGVRELYYDYKITQGGSYAIEGYVNTVPPSVTSTPTTTVTTTPTTTVTTTATATVTTAPGGVFGNGADGACNASSSVDLSTSSCSGRSTADAISFVSSGIAASGSSAISLATPPSGLVVGDEVLIIVMQGARAGDYETTNISGISGSILSLDKGLTKTYDGSANKVMVQRVPHYTTVNVSGILTADAYSCSTFAGGVLFFRANGVVAVASSGSIDMSGKGFAGGGFEDTVGGYQGSSQLKCGAISTTANGGGGGGGLQTGGGGGAAYGTAGAGGAKSGDSGSVGGSPGSTYGIVDLTSKLLAGGGGGGGDDRQNGPAGIGGNGGGIIAIFADSITVSGKILSNGANSVRAYNTSGGAGGGAGGGVLLYGNNLTLGTALVTANGGTSTSGGSGGHGGNGGGGRISVRYKTTGTGTTSPAADSAALTSTKAVPAVAGVSSDRVMSFIEKLIKLIKPQ